MRKRSKAFLCMILLCALTGCQTKAGKPETQVNVETKQEDLDKLPEALQQVISGEGTFLDVKQKKEYSMQTYMLECEDKETVPASWESYIVSDVDGDGERELVIQVDDKKNPDSANASVCVLDVQGDTVFCYWYSKREILNVYKDGVMLGIGGEKDKIYYTVDYNGMEYIDINVAKTNYTTLSGTECEEYFVGQRRVSEKEYRQFMKKYSDKNRLEWIEEIEVN